VFDLLPFPRSVERTADSVPADTEVETVHDAAIAAQGYALEIGVDRIHLRFSDAAGERYGRATLDQIRTQSGPRLPGLIVRDWPDFPIRGYMLDISRDRVPRRETLQRIVDRLDVLRINHLQLYTEHTFAYPEHEVVWRDASPMTADDVHWLDALCRENGIELAANQNSFGHMERWLRHEPYRHLAETPDGWTTSWGARWPAAVLHPDQASFELVRGLYAELLPHFTSNRVNINCDETFELGKGRSKARVDRTGRGRVYLDFVNRILADLHHQGKDVLLWGDVVRQHHDLVDDLPREHTTALIWHYEAPVEHPKLPAGLEPILEEVGICEDVLRGFIGQVPSFASTGFPFWVCPGTSTWNSLLGRITNARANLLDAAEVGLAHGAGGYLITDWGDHGHTQPPSASLAPLAYGAAVSWCAASNRDLDLAAALDLNVFKDDSRRLGAAVLRAGDAYRQTGASAFNGSPLFYALLASGDFLAGEGAPTAAGIESTLETLDDAARDIQRAAPGCADGAIVQRELRQAIELARLGMLVLAHASGLGTCDAATWKACMVAAIEEQRACWSLRSRAGGLDDSLSNLRKTL